MKTFVKSAFAFATAILATSAMAQSGLGEDCGCPPLASRTSVALSTLTDANGNLPASATNLTCDNVYLIDEKVHVPAGGDLFIEPGTVIRGQFGTDVNAKALIVNRGGQIWANGTDCCPIIFTDNVDPLDGTYPVGTRGQWGGVIILGNATNNLTASESLGVDDGVGQIEGIGGVVGADARYLYGRTVASGLRDDNDNSGVMRYVSIRHGGTDVGDGNEINGLTCGSVGRGTTLEHIEVISNNDDGIEFFGGTVDLKYAVVQYCKDDYIDWDHGWNGRVQFAYLVQLPGASGTGDNGLECDGDDGDSNVSPLSDPQIYNVTIIGRGASDKGFELKERTLGSINNCIVANYPTAVQLDDSRPTDAYHEWVNGNLVIRGNRFMGATDLVVRKSGTALSAAEVTQFGTTDDNIAAMGIIDASLAIDPVTNAVTDGIDPIPSSADPNAFTTNRPPNDGWFDQVDYAGAFKPGGENWAGGWTLGSILGADNSLVECPGDLDGDNDVDIDDFLDFNSAFGSSCGN